MKKKMSKSPYLSDKPLYQIPSFHHMKDELVQLNENLDQQIQQFKKGMRIK